MLPLSTVVQRLPNETPTNEDEEDDNISSRKRVLPPSEQSTKCMSASSHCEGLGTTRSPSELSTECLR